MIYPATKRFNIYQIKPNDTLESISHALGKRTDEVIRFHNMFAKEEELISFEFTKNLKVLYITPFISEKHIDNIPKVNFLYDKKLALIPFTQNLNYAVKSNIMSNGKTIAIDCKKSVLFTQKIGDYYLFLIDSISNTDSTASLSMMDELSFEVAKAIYPLELVVDEEGKWIGIYNFKKITQRWENLKPTILHEFEGAEIDKRMLFYDQMFTNETRLTALLKNDVFLRAYFNGLYANHTHIFNFQTIVNIPIITNVKNVEYKIVQKIEEYVNDANLIEIKQEGKASDNRSLLDYEYELDEPCYTGTIPDGEYKAHYLLNSNHNYIEKIDLECSLIFDEINRLNFTAEIV